MREHRVTCHAHGTAGHVHRCDDARNPDNPFRFYAPVVMPLQIIAYGFDQRRPGFCVTKYAVINASAQGFKYRWRCSEIHIGHPQGQHIAACVATPLERIAIAAIDDLVEIEGGQNSVRNCNADVLIRRNLQWHVRNISGVHFFEVKPRRANQLIHLAV